MLSNDCGDELLSDDCGDELPAHGWGALSWPLIIWMTSSLITESLDLAFDHLNYLQFDDLMT